MKKAKKYRLARDIVIPAGTEVSVGSWTQTRTNSVSALVALDKDATGEFIIWFEEAQRLALVEEVA